MLKMCHQSELTKLNELSCSISDWNRLSESLLHSNMITLTIHMFEHTNNIHGKFTMLLPRMKQISCTSPFHTHSRRSKWIHVTKLNGACRQWICVGRLKCKDMLCCTIHARFPFSLIKFLHIHSIQFDHFQRNNHIFSNSNNWIVNVCHPYTYSAVNFFYILYIRMYVRVDLLNCSTDLKMLGKLESSTFASSFSNIETTWKYFHTCLVDII